VRIDPQITQITQMKKSSETGNWRLETRNSKFEVRNSKLGSLKHRVPLRCLESWILNFRFQIPCCLLPAACCLLLFGCGYHVAGRGDLLPPDVKTIAVPAFKNNSASFRIEQETTAAVRREILERTHYRITPTVEGADAVLRATVNQVQSGVAAFDLATGRATALQITVHADVRLEDLHTHQTLFSNSNYTFREEYQVSQSTPTLFEEDRPALERLSRDFARTVITDILENF